MSLLRACWAAAIFSLRLRFISAFAILGWLLFPAIFGVIALYLFSGAAASSPHTAYAVLGGGLVGYWGVTYLDAGNSVQNERWTGTLEQIFAVPTPLWVIVTGKVLGGLVWGLLSFIPTLALAFVGFKVFLPALDVVPFAVSFGLLTLSFLTIAVVLSPFFALWRWAFSMINGFELGTYVLCGFMFPVSILPAWLQVLAGALPPAWATRALYASTATGGAHDYLLWWLVTIGLTLLYAAAAAVLYGVVERRARVTGELALA